MIYSYYEEYELLLSNITEISLGQLVGDLDDDDTCIRQISYYNFHNQLPDVQDFYSLDPDGIISMTSFYTYCKSSHNKKTSTLRCILRE